MPGWWSSCLSSREPARRTCFSPEAPARKANTSSHRMQAALLLQGDVIDRYHHLVTNVGRRGPDRKAGGIRRTCFGRKPCALSPASPLLLPTWVLESWRWSWSLTSTASTQALGRITCSLLFPQLKMGTPNMTQESVQTTEQSIGNGNVQVGGCHRHGRQRLGAGLKAPL